MTPALCMAARARASFVANVALSHHRRATAGSASVPTNDDVQLGCLPGNTSNPSEVSLEDKKSSCGGWVLTVPFIHKFGRWLVVTLNSAGGAQQSCLQAASRGVLHHNVAARIILRHAKVVNHIWDTDHTP